MTKKSDKNVVTRGILNEAVDALLAGMDNLFQRFKNELHKELKPMKTDITFMKRDINDIKAETFPA